MRIKVRKNGEQRFAYIPTLALDNFSQYGNTYIIWLEWYERDGGVNLIIDKKTIK